MAMRVVVARFHVKTIGTGPFTLRVNNSFSRMKHFDNKLPFDKHTKRPTSTLRLITNGVAIGVVIGAAYSYFTASERRLPGTIINTPIQSPILKTLPSDLKVTRKVRTDSFIRAFIF